jgi:small subunit ribosomal protein S16
MLVIRLQRVGKKNQPSYRIVLAEKTAPVKGKFIEILGNYNPRLKMKSFKKERVLYWLSQGAQASPTVHNLLIDEKIIEGTKRKAWAPKKKEIKEVSGEPMVKPGKTEESVSVETAVEEQAEAEAKESMEEPKGEEGGKKEEKE